MNESLGAVTFVRFATSILITALFCGEATLGQEANDGEGLLAFPESAFVVRFDGNKLDNLHGPEGTTIARSPDGHALLSGQPADAGSGGRPGIYVEIPSPVEQKISGHTVKVTVVARQSPKDGTPAFAVSYSTAESGDSGWRQFGVTDSLAAYSFLYDVPEVRAAYGDYVGILPDPNGSGGAIEIAAIAVEVMNPPDRTTAFYDLDIQHIQLPPVNSFRGSIAKVGDDLLYASQKGRLFRIAGSGASIDEIDLPIPLPYQDPLLARYNAHDVTIFDIAAKPSAGTTGSYDLYASYIGLDNQVPCVFMQLSKAVVSVSPDDVRVVSGWEDVFRTQPCLPIADKTDRAAIGNRTGGRIAFDDDRIILTVGVFWVDAQDDTSDYGKVLGLNRSTFEAHTISKGNRNAQGLYVDTDGTIWETEHGPRGGDEINIIADGKNYGWPVVSYGTAYGRLTYCNWWLPGSCNSDTEVRPEEQGRHIGFEQPVYAFVPSIGISQIVKVTSNQQFPIWNGDVLVASLVGETLYRVHVIDQRVLVASFVGETLYQTHTIVDRRAVLAEPIPLGARLRDMVELDDGRIAILTDQNELLIVSNAKKNAERPAAFFEGIVGAELADLIAQAQGVGDAARGKRIFSETCASCHSDLAAGVMNGPPLGCAFGGGIASNQMFAYSGALRGFASNAWTPNTLDDLLRDAGNWTTGTSMANTHVDGAADRADLIAYLALVRSTNCTDSGARTNR